MGKYYPRTTLWLIVDYFNKGMSEWEPAIPELETIEKVMSLQIDKQINQLALERITR